MIILDFRDKRPIYEQVVEKLSQLIICGALSADTRLPSVRNLAMDLSVNPNTIQRAYAILEQEGYIYTITGRGNYIASPASWQKGKLSEVIDELTKALEKSRLVGMSKTEVLAFVDQTYKNEE